MLRWVRRGSDRSRLVGGMCRWITVSKSVGSWCIPRSPKVTFTSGLQRIRYLLHRSDCFRPSDRWAGWDSHPLEIANFHGVPSCWAFLWAAASSETPANHRNHLYSLMLPAMNAAFPTCRPSRPRAGCYCFRQTTEFPEHLAFRLAKIRRPLHLSSC